MTFLTRTRKGNKRASFNVPREMLFFLYPISIYKKAPLHIRKLVFESIKIKTDKVKPHGSKGIEHLSSEVAKNIIKNYKAHTKSYVPISTSFRNLALISAVWRESPSSRGLLRA